MFTVGALISTCYYVCVLPQSGNCENPDVDGGVCSCACDRQFGCDVGRPFVFLLVLVLEVFLGVLVVVFLVVLLVVVVDFFLRVPCCD